MRILNFNVIIVSVSNRIDHELYEKFSKAQWGIGIRAF